MADQHPPPLLTGRGFVPVEDFCAATGADAASVREAIEAGLLDGLTDDAGRAVALLDDALPTPAMLTLLTRDRPQA